MEYSVVDKISFWIGEYFPDCLAINWICRIWNCVLSPRERSGHTEVAPQSHHDFYPNVKNQLSFHFWRLKAVSIRISFCFTELSLYSEHSHSMAIGFELYGFSTWFGLGLGTRACQLEGKYWTQHRESVFSCHCSGAGDGAGWIFRRQSTYHYLVRTWSLTTQISWYWPGPPWPRRRGWGGERRAPAAWSRVWWSWRSSPAPRPRTGPASAANISTVVSH